FRNASVGHPALLFQSERHPLRAVSWEELSRNVGSVANALRALGVKPGDRVVAYMANLPETVIAFLACASIGAVWSSCPPDFGTTSCRAIPRSRLSRCPLIIPCGCSTPQVPLVYQRPSCKDTAVLSSNISNRGGNMLVQTQMVK